jgi:hypothetical protein
MYSGGQPTSGSYMEIDMTQNYYKIRVERSHIPSHQGPFKLKIYPFQSGNQINAQPIQIRSTARLELSPELAVQNI